MTSGPLSPRRRRFLWIAGSALVLFTVFGFLIAPSIVKAQLEKRASAALGRTVTVRKVRVNPYALSVTLEDFDIRLKEGDGSFLGWRRLYVNFDALASLTGDWVLSEIELEGFHASTIITRDGSLNFSDILAKLNTPVASSRPPAQPGRPVRIGSLKVKEARVDFSDESRPAPFATIVGPMSFSITELRTAGAKGAPYHFEAVTESVEKLAWTGTISAEPLRSVGELSVEDIVLTKYTPYYSDRMRADVVAGKLSVHGRYEIDLTAGERRLKLSDGSLRLRELKMVERATKEMAIELPVLDIAGVNADALAMKAAITSIAMSGGHFHVRRENNGVLNLLAMLQPPAPMSVARPTPPLAVVPAAAPSKLPEVTIGEVTLKDFQMDITDLAAPRPVQLGLGGIQVAVKNVSLADGATMPLQLDLNWAPQGAVHVEGNVSIRPAVIAELKTTVSNLAILPLSPYVEQFVNARITEGSVSTTGAVKVALASGIPAINFDGSVTVEKFGLVDVAHNEPLAGFGSLTLTGLKIATAPQLAVDLAEVNLTAPYARLLINADKSLNLAGLAKPGEAAGPIPATETASALAAPPASKIAVARVMIADGDFSLTDRSLEPNVQMGVKQFGGTLAGLSSENRARAEVDLKAVVDGSGPIAISGKLDPLGATKFVDLKVDFNNVDLLPLSPYSGKYAGYELARGKLQLAVAIKLEGKTLDSSNVITLNQFTFGPAVKSPDATGLPVRLGVALLKDLNGQIVIDVPMSGSIDDPNLRIGKVVWRVIGNLLTKVATSPFALLGSMFGGGGDELAYQDFSPGEMALLPAQQTKLATMVKALTNRPGLSLALEGGYDGPADTFAIKQRKLIALVRSKVWEERHALNPNGASPEKMEITPEVNAAMVKKIYDEKFPPGTQFGAPPPKAPIVVAPPPPPKKGFFGRVVDVFTFKSSRQGEAKPAEPAKPGPATVPGADGSEPVGLSMEEMNGRLADTMVVSDDDLRALAMSRAQTVRDYFINEGKISPDRLFLAQGQEAAKANKGPRVFLNLQ